MSSSDGDRNAEDADDESDGDSDLEKQADELAEQLAQHGDDCGPHEEPVELLRDPRPEGGGALNGEETDAVWARRSLEERLSAAGAANQAVDRSVVGEGDAGGRR